MAKPETKTQTPSSSTPSNESPPLDLFRTVVQSVSPGTLLITKDDFVDLENRAREAELRGKAADLRTRWLAGALTMLWLASVPAAVTNARRRNASNGQVVIEGVLGPLSLATAPFRTETAASPARSPAKVKR